MREILSSYEHNIGFWKEQLNNVHSQLLQLKSMHDQKYVETSSSPRYTHSLPSPEDFFIRKFNGDLNITSKELRLEEAILQSQLISVPEPEYKHRIQNFTRIRDYLALCRGESLNLKGIKNPKKKYSEEKCFLTHRNDPYLYLSPLKMEVIMKHPLQLYIFHSVLTPSEINKINGYVALMDTPFYEDADDPDGGYWSGTWNYEQIWLEDHFALPIFKTSRLLNKITRLQVTSPDMDGRESEIPVPFKRVPDLHPASDHLMAGTYSPSGFYYVHYDDWKESGKGMSPRARIATAMIYLSNVDGGATVFPNVGRTIYPNEGSVVYWYNLYSDGNRNPYTLHGGCPVLHGIKTIGNKWIHYSAQMFKKLCTENDRKEYYDQM